jgi:YidC/Oxa1 family membrane protein insertase
VGAVVEGLLAGLGSILSFFYSAIPSYGLAIILLTVLVRVALFPLTYRQTRSMQAMQRLQPKLKELQRKHKGNRQKLNEEMMKLYKEHQVNPLGGCLPLLLQFPVFIALYAVLRGTIAHAAVPAESIDAEALSRAVCSPSSEPAPTGVVSDGIVCEMPGGEEQTFTIEEWRTNDRSRPIVTPGAYMSHCIARDGGEGEGDYFVCSSPVGISHLPTDSELRAQIITGETPFLGMELGCSPTQAISEEQIRQCADPEVRAGGFPLVGYFGLVALMVFTTYYQTKQMQRRAGPQAQPGQQAMARIMPLFLGFISLSIPTGVLLYWVTSNGIQIGQQTLMLRSSSEAEATPSGDGKPARQAGPGKKPPAKPSGKSEGSGSRDGGQQKKSGKSDAGSRKKRRKR